MSNHMATHPLDVDLLDFVESACDAARAQGVEGHLAGCIVCRIKVQRLRDASPIDLTPVTGLAVPSFALLQVDDVGGDAAQPGELWLTAENDALMVLVRSVRPGGAGVVVVPVIGDVEVADGSAIVLDETVSPLGVPIAIFGRLVVSLPTAALSGRLGTTPGGPDLLAVRDGDPGVSRGSRLEGSSDPRLEVRQYLIDRLAALDTHPSDRPSEPATTTSVLSSLRDDLSFFRGDVCLIAELATLPDLPGHPAGWRGVARVSEFGIRIIVIETPGGLSDEADRVAAQALLFRLDASAIVVSNGRNDLVDLYDPPTLFKGYELPKGEATTYPRISGLALVDTIAKFLDQKSPAALSIAGGRGRAESVDVEMVLAGQVAQNVAAKLRGASRLGKEKRQGVLRLEHLTIGLADALRAALRPDFDTSVVADVVDRQGR